MGRRNVNVLALILIAGGLVFGVSPVAGPAAALAEEEKAPEAQPAAPEKKPETAEAETPATPPPPQAERIEGKLIKVDAETKTITVLVEPEKGSSSRAYRRVKMVLDDKSLVMIDQAPATLANLESGQLVQVMYFDKGKQNIVDVVMVMKED